MRLNSTVELRRGQRCVLGFRHNADSESWLQTSNATFERPLDVLEALNDLTLDVEVNADLVRRILFQHYTLFLQFTRWHCINNTKQQLINLMICTNLKLNQLVLIKQQPTVFCNEFMS